MFFVKINFLIQNMKINLYKKYILVYMKNNIFIQNNNNTKKTIRNLLHFEIKFKT